MLGSGLVQMQGQQRLMALGPQIGWGAYLYPTRHVRTPHRSQPAVPLFRPLLSPQDLSQQLATITGFDAVSLQPNSGESLGGALGAAALRLLRWLASSFLPQQACRPALHPGDAPRALPSAHAHPRLLSSSPHLASPSRSPSPH